MYACREFAYEELRNRGIDFSADFHTLSFSDAELLAEWAKRTKYRKPKNANGSTGRYFFEHLKRRYA